MQKIGFLINPIAGMGGKVGLKGTDGVYEEALKRGALPVTPRRARKFLENVKKGDMVFLTASGAMGADALNELEFRYRVIYRTPERTSSEDTKKACLAMLENGIDMIVFVGGDGTARDVTSIVDSKVPVLGVPSGVKMYSSIFCVTPAACGELLNSYIEGTAKLKDGEVLDIDEQAYRNNNLKIKLYGFVKTPYLENLVQNSKTEYGYEDEEDKEAIAEFFAEHIKKDTLYMLGAGTTVSKIAERLGVKKTLLGIDAYLNGNIIGKDLTENEIFNLIKKSDKVMLVVTPIGSQGFVFGRGNQQISERVLWRVPRENIIIVATPLKLSNIKYLRADVENLEHLRGYYRVLIGYGKYKMMKMV